ncbi:MAG: protein kinase [Anaerolineae bacterium]|nr:protein kinase [Anaerolineae bacterium]
MTQKPKSWIGQTLGERYQIESLLGRGGMSSVYRATDQNLKRSVAVKIIHPHLTKRPEFVQQFEQEATAVAQLRHQNIVRVYDFKRDQGIYYMVLEYIPGETLANKLAALNQAEMRLPLTESVRIAINLCDAVDYAHQRRMIHRDIKPQNIMLNLLGEPILMDFGITKLVGQEANNLGNEAPLGTALYMSPEQIKGGPIDYRTDVYALGIVLYEMLAGHPPFQGNNTKEIMHQQLERKLPDLHLANPNIPQTLIAIVERALEKQPERRYSNAGDMTTALQSVVLTLQNPLETLGSRQLEHLARLWLQASEAFDETNYIGCIEKIDELTRTGADYQTEQGAQLREESTKRLYEQAVDFFQEGHFGEALVVITALRELAPHYPNLGHLESQVRQSVQSNSIQSDLDLLYEAAVTALEAHEYEEALNKWEAIEVKRGSLPYRDRMQVEERAKSGICARLYNDAFLSVAQQQPYLTLAIWKKIKAMDPDFPDEDGVLELAQRMLDSDSEIKRRDKRLIIGALVAGALLILLAIGWRFSNRGNVMTNGESTSQAAAIVAETVTDVPTKTAVPPTQTPTKEPTNNSLVSESAATATDLPTAAPTDTAAPQPTDTPAATQTPTPTTTPTPTNVGLVLENSSMFATPNLDGEELSVVEEGAAIVVMGRSEDSKWLFIGNGDTAGFVFRDRLQWDGEVDGLPVFTHSDRNSSTEAETPVASENITPLEFDLWPLAETAVCTSTGWEQKIFFQGHGGNGIYAYYWNGKLLEGPTNSSYVYRLVSPGGAVTGTGRVESGGGLWQESTLFVEAPNCE